MSNPIFSDEDIRQIKAHGISEEQVISQIEIFKKAAPFVKLNRPCAIDDGIKIIPEGEFQYLTLHHHQAAKEGRFLKFVPASGAASRMFKVLRWFNNQTEWINREDIAKKTEQGDQRSHELLSFMEGIKEFAFFDDLKSVMSKGGFHLETLLERDHFKEILDYLLTPRGLNYAGLPKGLLKFHRYPEGSRTAFEEHLIEAADYIRDAKGNCRLHFTVSQEHQKGFERLLNRVRPLYEQNYKVRFQVDFSVQKQSTDTIAVDLNNRPFRQKDGSLLFRPGGHGALIENLNDLEGDIIYIKNIDNVVPDRLKEKTFIWKKLLGGYLVKIQKEIFAYMEKLTAGKMDKGFLEETLEFSRDKLYLMPPEGQRLESAKEKREFLLLKLNRPLRICGVVKNEGEPGGAPYWVEGKDGALSLQIVELSQINLESEQQRALMASSTHFNPVDIVCGVKDYRGRSFDLKRYVDPAAVFISRKSQDGLELKALELPGLWNGAMADWTSIFIEVPAITFNPVKTVNDLLRKEHRHI